MIRKYLLMSALPAFALMVVGCANQSSPTGQIPTDGKQESSEPAVVSTEPAAVSTGDPADTDTEDKALAEAAEQSKKQLADLKKQNAELAASLAKLQADAELESEKAKASEELKAQVKKLAAENREANNDWRASFNKAKTRSQRQELAKQNPSEAFGKSMMALYEEKSDLDGSHLILNNALMQGSRDVKVTAAEKMLELAPNQDPKTAEGTYILLAQFATGNARIKALKQILELGKSETGEEAIGKLTQVCGAPGTEGADVRQEAAKLLLEKVSEDLRSKKAAKALALIGRTGDSEVSAKAYDHLLTHHIDSPIIEETIQRLPRMPKRSTETLLKAICDKGTGAVKAKAAIAFNKFNSTRSLYAGYYASADDKTIEAIGKETYDYLMETPPENQMAFVEGILVDYVDSNDAAIETAKEELFVIQNLSVGKTAPDIVANDLDGKEFKLSDYRGKVVFLDFWGDW